MLYRKKCSSLNKKKKPSSQRWLLRQANDPYVHAAQKAGLRSRSAFKLQQLHQQQEFLKSGMAVLDLGCAPGGWCQMASQLMKSTGTIVGVDLQKMAPLPGVSFIQGDIFSPVIQQQIANICPAFDVILSDLAPSSTGHAATNHLQSMGLVREVWGLAKTLLKPGGTLVMKILQGGQEGAFYQELRPFFHKIFHIKPPASRRESVEIYMVAVKYV